MVGFVRVKVLNPRLSSDTCGSVRPVGGVELPSPFAASAAKTSTVPVGPTPETLMSSDPKFQAPVVFPKAPLKVLAPPRYRVPGPGSVREFVPVFPAEAITPL